jgi:hypothetical protein
MYTDTVKELPGHPVQNSPSGNFLSWGGTAGRGGNSIWYCGMRHTDKKENRIFLIYKKIQSGAVAKSYMRKGFLIYGEMRKYFPIYEEAVSHIWLCNCSFLNFLIYEENLIFFFLSVQKETLECCVHLYAFVSYRRLSPQFQFSLSGVILVYLSQWFIV